MYSPIFRFIYLSNTCKGISQSRNLIPSVHRLLCSSRAGCNRGEFLFARDKGSRESAITSMKFKCGTLQSHMDDN